MVAQILTLKLIIMILTYNAPSSNKFIRLREVKGNHRDFLELKQLQEACKEGFFYILQLPNKKASEYIVCNEGWNVPVTCVS